MNVRDHQGSAGGLVLILVGLFATIQARQYDFGSISHMGPGFFPTILGLLLAFLGALIFLSALKGQKESRIRVQWRSLGFILASIIVFACTLQRLGLVPSVFAVVVVASLAMVLPLGWWAI